MHNDITIIDEQAVTVACGSVWAGDSTLEQIQSQAVDDAKERLATLINGVRDVKLSGIHDIAISLNSGRIP